MLAIVGLSMVAAAALAVPLQGFGLMVALYTYAAYSDKDDGALTLAIFGFFTFVSLVLADAVGFAGVNALVFLTAWVLGDRARAHRMRTADLQRRAHALERERDVRARLAVADERNRIARELHDVVSHGVMAMITQATAAERVMGADPSGSGAALLDVEQTGRASLVDCGVSSACCAPPRTGRRSPRNRCWGMWRTSSQPSGMWACRSPTTSAVTWPGWFR